MNIIQFLKLIKKNLIIILIVPMILGSIVWYMTRHETKYFSSKTTVYTGVGSGLSMEALGTNKVDFFGSKIVFDNIINIFKARSTHKEVALRLFAQGLSLKSWDPRYISRASYIRLHKNTPKYITDMVATSDTVDLIALLKSVPLVLNDTSNLKNKRIVWESTWYQVGMKETLFSLSDKFAVSVSNLMNWNELTSTTLVRGQNIIVQRKEKVVFSDFTNNLDTIDLYVPDTTFFIQAEIDSVAFEKTVERFRRYADANDTNYLYRLLSKSDAYYSVGAIGKNKAKRIQGSDLVQITYKSSDPGVCQQTLSFIIFAFEKYYRNLNENQSDHIVAYFEKQVKESAALLVAAENRLLQFNQDNNIINYYEQTRHISDQKEQLDSKYYDEKMKFSAADSVIRILEAQLASQSGVSSLNNSLLEYRNELSEITYKIAINELNDSKDPKAVTALQELSNDAQAIKNKISENLNNIYQLQYSPEGVNVRDILSQWLNKVIEYEESKATLGALYERKKEFQKTYEIFAPLGAKLKRIEREIDVYEQQYMSHLHSLNQAKLKQQNLEFKSNIKVVDPPYFPLSPEKSSRMMMIAASSIVGIVMVLFIIILLEYLDQTVKFPKRAEKLTGIPLLSAYPILTGKKKAVNYDYISNRLIEIMIQNLRGAQKKLKIVNENGPVKIIIFSTQITDGKSIIQERMGVELQKIGHSVLSVNYNIASYEPKYRHAQGSKIEYLEYPVDDNYFNKKNFSDLIGDGFEGDLNTYDYVIVELPSTIHHPFPPEIVKDADFGIMVVRANRTWQQADVHSLNSVKEFLKVEPMVFLNGVNPEFLQDLIGEIPRKRSRIRRIVKKLIRLQVFERYQIKKW